jgi:hypothetical protein
MYEAGAAIRHRPGDTFLAMKFLINSDCLIFGEHIAEGAVVTVSEDIAAELMLANRGRVVPHDYSMPIEEPAKAVKPTKK